MKILKENQNRIYIAVIAISAIAILILGAGYLKNKKADSALQDETQIAAMKEKDGKVYVSVSTETIEDGLTNMGILITQEYYFTQIEKYTKEKVLFNVLPTSSEFMYSYDGAVMAGIDFEKIKVKKDENEKIITVELPHSEIQATTIDKDTFKIYSEKDSLWNPLKLEDYNLSLSEFEEAAKQKALDGGIIDRSDEQAMSLIRNFIGNFPSASGYEIRFDWRSDYES